MILKKRFLICTALLVLTQAAKAEALTLYAAHKEGDLNIRSSPHGSRIGYLLPGDSAEFVKQDGEWIYVAVGIEAGGGWVNAQYLTADPDAAGSYLNNSGGRLRVRKTPGGNAVGWLEKGKTVEVLSVLPDQNGGQWGRTKNGYVAMKYLDRRN